jgi:hypothetical protein
MAILTTGVVARRRVRFADAVTRTSAGTNSATMIITNTTLLGDVLERSRACQAFLNIVSGRRWS